VDGDTCLKCGVVISKFLAAKKRQAAENPYAAPEADLTEDREGEDSEMTGPHRVPAGHGWSWIRGGFGHFRRNPGGWILGILAMGGIAFVTGLIPVIGSIAFTLLSPIFGAGFMIGARDQEAGGDFEVRHVGAGFSNNAGQLILVGVFYMIGTMLIGVAAAFLAGALMFSGLAPGGMPPTQPMQMQGMPAQDGGMQGGMDMQGDGNDWQVEEGADGDPQFAQFDGTEDPLQGGFPGSAPTNEMEALSAMFGPGFLIVILVVLALLIPIMMAYWFAPALVALNGMSALAAMKLSFVACLRNFVPFLIYGLIGLVLAVLAILPVGLGMLVLGPVMTASIYTSYRDIFYGVEETL